MALQFEDSITPILLQSCYLQCHIISSSGKKNNKQTKEVNQKWIIIIPAWFEISCHCFFIWLILVARNSQDVTRSALGEVWVWLVDLGLDNNRALSPTHAALDGTRDVHLQLPLLTADVYRRWKKKEESMRQKERCVIEYRSETALFVMNIYGIIV